MLVDILTGIFALILAPIIFLTSFWTCKKYWIPNAKTLNEHRGTENQLPTGYWIVWAKNMKEIFLDFSLRDL